MVGMNWLAQLTRLCSVSDEVSLPPGYSDALAYNLAVALAPEYGRNANAVVMEKAAEALVIIKRANFEPSLLSCDMGLLRRGR
jgi:hypothetical protein